MRRTRSAALTLLLLPLCGCDQPDGYQSPSGVFGPSTPEPPPLVRSITLESATPPPASTLSVEDCLPSAPISDRVFCTNQLVLGFSVLAEQDISNGLLVATLTGDGGPWCGALFGIVDRVALGAGTRTSVTVSAWQVPATDDSATDGLAKGPPCPKTMTTSGLVEARLYDGVVSRPVTYEAFCCYVYTVIRP